MKTKRILSLALALAMLLTLCPITAMATSAADFAALISRTFTSVGSKEDDPICTLLFWGADLRVSLGEAEAMSAKYDQFVFDAEKVEWSYDYSGEYDLSILICTKEQFTVHYECGEANYTYSAFTEQDTATEQDHTDDCVTDGERVAGAVDGYVWKRLEDCDIDLYPDLLNLENYMDYNNFYLLTAGDFSEWKQNDNTPSGLADRSFISATGVDNGDGYMKAWYQFGSVRGGSFTKLPPETNGGELILPSAMGSGEEFIPVVLVLSNGTEYYYGEYKIGWSFLNNGVLYVPPVIDAAKVSPMHFGPHAYTGDYVIGEGDNAGKHGRKCSCGAVGGWTDHVYTDGKCVCGAKLAASISDTYYATLQAAVAAAQPEDIITLLCNCEGNGILIDKSLTIDFAGFTYTVSGEATGGSETSMNQGFHIEYADHSTAPGVTLKNGTLAVPAENLKKTIDQKPVTRMLQNYVDLTMENMIITDENVQLRAKGVHNPAEDAQGYVSLAKETLVECDSGISKFTNCTITATLDNRYALALDDRQGMCPTGTHITVVGGTITGNVRFYEEDNGDKPLVSTLTFDEYVPTTLTGTITDDTNAERESDDKVKVVIHAMEKDKEFVTTEVTDKETGEPVIVIVEIENKLMTFASLTLNENINVNFYVAVPNNGKWDGSKLTLRSSFPNEAGDKTMDYVYEEGGYLYYRAVVTEARSYQMNEKFSVEVFYDGVSQGTLKDYSVRTYLEAEATNKKNSEAMRNLCLATLSYGGAAQRFFSGKSYKDGKYPTFTKEDYVDGTMSYKGSVEKPTNKAKLTTAIGTISDYSASLVLGNEVSLKIYFTTTNINGLTVACDKGSVTQVVSEGSNRYSFKLTGLSALELGEDYTFTLSQGSKTDSITYSPYVFLKQNWEDADIGTLCKAIKAYGDCATAAFPAK